MNSSKYDRHRPFLSTIKERYSLCKPGSGKNTEHLILDLAGSGIQYEVGDCLGVIPKNDPMLVEKTIQAMRSTGNEIIINKQNEKQTLREFLTTKANLVEISRKLLSEIGARQTNPAKKQEFALLHAEGNQENLKEYIATRHIWDTLEEHADISFEIQELCNLFMPLLPRFYSISSSQKLVGDEVHLTVAQVKFISNGHHRVGVCTNYLGGASLGTEEIPVFVHPHRGFTLPEPDKALVMIGPGTGVAPFRAFMQERLVQNASGKNWLFFGERNRSTDFLYEDFWKSLSEQQKLRLDLAFSRDQSHKIYVQHRLLEQGADLFQWLEQGAYLYVCGDAQRMAKDVESALLSVFQIYGKQSEQESKNTLKKLRQEKRYLRDVY